MHVDSLWLHSCVAASLQIQRPTVPVVMNMGDVEPLCEGLSQENLEVTLHTY